MDPENRIKRAFSRRRQTVALSVDPQRNRDLVPSPPSLVRRALVPALSAAGLVLVSVGVFGLLRGGDAPVAVTTTTSSSVPASTTTTSEPGTTTTTTVPPDTTTTGPPGTTTTTPPTTTTTEPPPTTTTTTPPEPAAGYRVVGVDVGDVLNVRSGPGVEHPVVGTLAADAAGIETTGLATPSVPTSGWWEMRLESGRTGWVNSAFLAPVASWSAPFSEHACFAASQPGAVAGNSDADHVFGLEYLSSPECDRMVVLLGAGARGGGDWPSTPAARVPPGIEAFGAGAEVVVPMVFGMIETVRPTATEATFDVGAAFVVRRGAGPLDLRLHFASARSASVSYLADPARVVIDLAPDAADGRDHTPVAGPGTALVGPIVTNSNAATMPAMVTGYGRPFEATGVAEVRTAAAEPGTGAPVEATFCCDFGTVTATSYPFLTTEYVSAWGAFGFEIDGLTPGDYGLFVGEYSAADGSPVGVYHAITVVE